MQRGRSRYAGCARTTAADPTASASTASTCTWPPAPCMGLLGPNGAGKTTTVRILTTLLRTDDGEASVAGYDVRTKDREVRRRIGLVGQAAAVDEVLTGRQNLVLIGRLNHLSQAAATRRADELLERFALTDAAARPVAHLLRRHAAPARPRRGARRATAGVVRRRADHRARSAGSPRGVVGDRRSGPRRHHRAADHPVPGGGRPAGGPDLDPASRARGRRGHARRAEAADRR